MSGSHGDLFREIGKLVLAAHAGQSIDLSAKSEELAERYGNLGMPAELIAKAIARSLGAISVSMAIVASGAQRAYDRHANGANGHSIENGGNGRATTEADNGYAHCEAGEAATTNGAQEDRAPVEAVPADAQARAASVLFPSGLRLAVLS